MEVCSIFCVIFARKQMSLMLSFTIWLYVRGSSLLYFAKIRARRGVQGITTFAFVFC